MAIDFQRIQGVFQAAAVLPSAERAAMLERECGDDGELRRRIEALLQAHDDSGELPAAEAEPDRTYVPAVEPGQVFAGRYKLRQKLAEGGMGVVFVADQTAPVQRRVALKIIRAGLDTRRLLARFEQERQALALMDHPNIAKVFDAGMDEAQRPYFAMELVKGLPLTRYCDDARLSPRQRLELFIPVCQAVQHAHQKGIIHRDLKPSNILVGLYDGRPVPKVIDFGVAKATGPRLTEQSLYTEVGSIIGTLEYMSPEQAELNNLDIDTRSDIYALGVILYELLTGSVPFGRKELEQAGLAEMLRVIKEKEPPKPSTKLSSSQELPTIAACRKLEPRKLTQLVQGELDWIVMKALEKDRARRFETANGLARDIERYLADQPVQAGPPSASYRLRKFVRRNRAVLSAAGLVLIALAAGTTISIWQAIRATRAEHLAQARLEAEGAARQEAQGNFQMARAVVDDMYTQVAEKWLANQPQMEPVQREFLEKALHFYEKVALEKATDPSLRAETARAYHRVGAIRAKLGGHPEAEKAFREAIQRWTELADEFPDVPDHRRNLAETLATLGPLLGHTGRPAEAEKVRRRAVTVLEKLVADFPAVPVYRRDLGRIYFVLLGSLQRAAERQEVHRSAVAIQRKLVRESPLDPDYRYDLAMTLGHTGGLTTHEQRREGIAILEKLVAEFPNRPNYVQVLAQSYYTHSSVLAGKEAEQALQKVLALQRKLVKDFPAVPGYRDDLRITLRAYGRLLGGSERTEEAERAFQEAIQISEELATGSPTVLPYRSHLASTYTALANLLKKCGRPADAERAYRRSIDVAEGIMADFPNNDPLYQLETSYSALVNFLTSAGRKQEVQAVYDRALKLNPKSEKTHNALGMLLQRFGQSEAAVKEFQKAIELNPKNAQAHTNLGRAFQQLDRHDEAGKEYRKAIELDPKDHSFRSGLAMFLSKLGRVEQAAKAYDKAIELDPKCVSCLNNLGWLLATCPDPKVRDPAKAVALAKKAVEINPKEGTHWNTLGAAHYGAGQWSEAIAALKKSMELQKGGDGFDWFFLAMAHWRLGEKEKARDWYAKAVEWMAKNKPKDDELLRFRAEAAELLGVPAAPATNAKQVPGVKDK